AHDAKDIYYVPSLMEQEGLSDYLMEKLKLTPMEISHEWDELMEKMASIDHEIRVAVVGKYAHLGDSYISINEALKHAGVECGCRVKTDWIDAEEFEKKPDSIDLLKKYNGILVPGGFGVRGTEGKILAIKYAREHNMPYLGLCLGMQLAVIEFARNVVGLKDANSSELVKTEHPVIDLLPEQENVRNMGGTMRLGNCEAVIKEGSLAHKIYGSTTLIERHRHRYEVNPKYIPQIEAKGMKFTGKNDHRMEIAEIPGHKFFFSSQFHPEFRSRPGKPSPPFLAFVKAALQ
ncbi:MAG: CTP synthase, partial [Candidatus Methanoperedens sp.]|nr:CTP synthase [Candidatus Methanoperedens sp.]